MIAVVLVAGIVGAVIRYSISRAFAASRLPWAVLIVNVVGSLIGGTVLGLSVVGVISPEWRLVLLTGLCGGLTTFSTFSVESVQLIIDGKWRVAAASIAANLVLGIAAAAAGFGIVVSQA